MRSEDRLLKALFGEPRFWASYEEMAIAAEKLQAENVKLKAEFQMLIDHHEEHHNEGDK